MPGLVDVEASDDDESGGALEVAPGHGNLMDNVLADEVDVVLQNGRDGNNGRGVGDSTCHKLLDEKLLSETSLG